MKALVVSIWVFINLIFFGMCGYMYLLWSQYWMYMESQETTTIHNYDQQIYLYNRGLPLLINVTTKSHEAKNRTKHSIKQKHLNNVTLIKNSRPRFPNLQSDEYLMDNRKFVCDTNTQDCFNKTNEFKTKIINELKRVFLDESNVFKSGLIIHNPYNVNYKGQKGNYLNKTPQQIMCELKQLDFKTIRRSDEPFVKYDIKNYIPKRKLFENKHFNSCAIVSSAGALKNSNLGKLIDSHDLVLRFNNAPTKNYEKDVGSKTTIRVLNSQVVSKQEFDFVNSDLYKNITLVTWDPSNYTSSLEEWYQNPDYNFFEKYIEHRRKNRSKVYLLNPKSLWRTWDFLQENSPNRIRRNPPSSGFLGLRLLLPHCNFVDFFEYIPSARVSSRCHYYDHQNNAACTFGVWHPLAAEKLLVYHLNNASDRMVFQNGFVRIPGFNNNIKCT